MPTLHERALEACEQEKRLRAIRAEDEANRRGEQAERVLAQIGFTGERQGSLVVVDGITFTYGYAPSVGGLKLLIIHECPLCHTELHYPVESNLTSIGEYLAQRPIAHHFCTAVPVKQLTVAEQLEVMIREIAREEAEAVHSNQ